MNAITRSDAGLAILCRLLGIQSFSALCLMFLIFADEGTIAVFANMLCPLVTFVACSWATIKLVLIDRRRIISPITWATMVNGVYFGFGPLMHAFGDVDTISLATTAYAVDTATLLQVNFLNTVFFTILLASYIFLTSILPLRFSFTIDSMQTAQEYRALILAFGSLVVGCFFRFKFGLPHELGQLDYMLPGMVYQLEYFVPLALAPIFFVASRRGLTTRSCAVLFLLAEMVLGLLRYTKSAMVMPIIMSTIGVYLGTKSKLPVVFLTSFAIFTLIAFNRPVMNLREETVRMPYADGSTLLGRYEIVSRMISDGRLFESAVSGSAWWARFNYSSIQAFVMNRYDLGLEGNPYKDVLWSLVPRIIYPDKPITSSVGSEIAYLLMGETKTQIAAGFAAEAYWAGGWYMVTFIAVLVGLQFAALEALLARVPLAAIWTFFPCYILAIKMASRLDGCFSLDCVGSSVFFLGYYCVAILLERMVYPSMLAHFSEANNAAAYTRA